MKARLELDTRTLPLLLALVVAAGFFAQRDPVFAQAATYAGIFATAAIGLSMLLGNVAQISIGQAGFFGIGAYAVAYGTTALGVPYWVALAAGSLLAGIAGLAVGFIALRFSGHYLAMATLAFGLIVQATFKQIPGFGGAGGISNIPFPTLGPFVLNGSNAYWFAWVVAALAAVGSLALLRGRTGLAFEAIRNDELAAEVSGVPTRRYKIFAFTYAGTLAGVAGGVYAGFLGLIVPDAVGVGLSIDLLLMVVLGGSGGVSGAIVGAALIGFLDIEGHAFENVRQVVYGLLVIVVAIAFPGGLAALGRAFVRPRAAAAPSAAATFAPRAIEAPDRVALALEGVTKRFGGLVAVENATFALEAGTLTALIGPNGAGKTTLFNAINGVGTVTQGRVRVAGLDVTGRRPHRIAALGVGRTFQNARLFNDMTVLENVTVGAFRLGESAREASLRAHATLHRLNVAHLAPMRAADLAFGDRRRVEIARALAGDPWLLMLDEPAAGLNASERARLRDDLLGLRAQGVTMLLIEHDMRLVMAISDRVLVLEFGRTIADGDARTVRNDPAVIFAYLGTAS